MATFYPTVDYNSSTIKNEDDILSNNKWGDRYNLDHVVSIMYDSGNYYLVMDTGYKHKVDDKDMAAINNLISSSAGNVSDSIGDLVDGIIGKLPEDGSPDRNPEGSLVGTMNNMATSIDESMDKLVTGLTETFVTEMKAALQEGLQPLSELQNVIRDENATSASVTAAIDRLTTAMTAAMSSINTRLNNMDSKLTQVEQTANKALQEAEDANDAWLGIDVDLGGAKDDVKRLEQRMNAVEQKNTSQDQDISNLGNRVTALENA